MKYDLYNKPKCPYGDLPWLQYYWEYSREIPSYEEDYWGCTTDPDGRIRQRTSPEEIQLAVEGCRDIVDMLEDHRPEGGTVLDVGCGVGALLKALPDTWVKYGTDVSEMALKEASKHATCYRGDLSDLCLPSLCTDVIVMNHVIEHIPDPMLQFVECARLLRPGGIFIVATPDFDSCCARRFKEKYRLLHDPGHVSLFTTNSLTRAMTDFGFIVSEVAHPYFGTRWATPASLLKVFDTDGTSPAFYGNFVTVLAYKKDIG